MLEQVIDQCPEKPYVIDDGSTFDCMPLVRKSYFHRLRHKGREQYYINWQYAFEICKQSSDDFFLFIPDDFLHINHNTIQHIYQNTEGKYVYNLLNDGRPPCWTPVVHKPVSVAGINSVRVSYVDCGYFTNRATLEAINFEQDFVSAFRFRRPGASSGVGLTQSRKMYKKFIPMYIPQKSLCYHGEHESKMHPQLRKIQPLISK